MATKRNLVEEPSFGEFLDGILADFENKLEPPAVTFNDLWIRPKEGAALLNLGENLNYMQKKFLAELGIDPTKKFSLKGIRHIRLKARQLGFTTLVAALFFCDTVNNKLRYSVIMAHDDDTTKKIFEIIKRFYDNLPESKKPRTKYNTKTDLTFDELDSQIYVVTAGSKSGGQGTTVNNVLCSEHASYTNPQNVQENLLEAVPSSGNIFIESTAEGIGNDFHIKFLEAQEGENGYTPGFTPWFDDPAYTANIPEDLEFVLTEKETKLQKLYDLSLGQLYWYRLKAKTLKASVVQEYPSTPEEAFISAGGDFFNGEILREYVETAKKLKPLPLPPMQDLPILYKECIIPQRATLTIWAKPQAGKRYIITGDSSEGEEDTKSDYSSVDIIEVDTRTQVGHLHGKLEPHILGRVLVELGLWYNKALIVPERNNHGHTVINEILHHTSYGKMDFHGWGGLYYHKEYDAAKRQLTNKPGLPTTARSKFLILDALNEAITNKDFAISCLNTLIEMLNYKSLGKGKYGAPNGLKDDRVMSIAIGAYVMLNLPRTIKRGTRKVIRSGGFI